MDTSWESRHCSKYAEEHFKDSDQKLLELYQDKNDVEAGREIAKRIKARVWTLGTK